jgi:hypothetical protein
MLGEYAGVEIIPREGGERTRREPGEVYRKM